MRLVTLLAVAVLRAGAPDGGQEQGAGAEGLARGLVVDTSAVSPPLRVRHGSIDGDKVREVVSSHNEEIRGCYERAVLESPQLSGVSTIHIVIDRDGTVGTASVQLDDDAPLLAPARPGLALPAPCGRQACRGRLSTRLPEER